MGEPLILTREELYNLVREHFPEQKLGRGVSIARLTKKIGEVLGRKVEIGKSSKTPKIAEEEPLVIEKSVDLVDLIRGTEAVEALEVLVRQALSRHKYETPTLNRAYSEAIKLGKSEIVTQSLALAGVDYKHLPDDILARAAYGGSYGNFIFLLEKLHPTTLQLEEALSTAISYGPLKGRDLIAEKLLEIGVDPDIDNGCPFINSVEFPWTLVKAFIKARVDLEKYGEKAIAVAEETGHHYASHLIREALKNV